MSTPGDVLKTEFKTREGVYRALSQESRHQKIQPHPMVSQVTTQQPHTPVYLSVVSSRSDRSHLEPDLICFNTGRELWLNRFQIHTQVSENNENVDKHIYKDLYPSCHCINLLEVSPARCMVLVGFSGGQCQLINALPTPSTQAFNVLRYVDPTKATSICWLPASTTTFLVSHVSGNIYQYQVRTVSDDAAPAGTAESFKAGYTVSRSTTEVTLHVAKSQSSNNPLQYFKVGTGAVNAIAFSPNGKLLAVASQDGLLRVFTWPQLDLRVSARSYFGGFVSLAWSPDDKFIVTGGEDDLVTVFAVLDGKVLCRCRGHKSWVSAVAFDPICSRPAASSSTARPSASHESTASVNSKPYYRFGSVGQDTLLCLWELTDEILQQPKRIRARSSVYAPDHPLMRSMSLQHGDMTGCANGSAVPPPGGAGAATKSQQPLPNLVYKLSTLVRVNRRKSDKRRDTPKKKRVLARYLSERLPSAVTPSSRDSLSTKTPPFGSSACPRLADVPLLTPLICKKVASEPVTSLLFLQDCLLLATQSGLVNTWLRPVPEETHTSL